MKRIIVILGWLTTSFLAMLMLISTFDHLDIFDSKNVFYGSDFFPAMWISPLALVPLILFILSGKRRNAFFLLVFTCLYMAAFGDFSLSFLHPRNQPTANSVKKVRVAALNVQYYDHGVIEVMNGILSLDADVALLSENDLPDTLASLVQRKIAPMRLYMGHRNSTAILSRYPVVDFKEIELPSHEASLSGSNDINDLPRQPHRSFVHAVLNVDGTYLHIISIRLIAGRPKNNTIEENFRWGKYLLTTQMQEVDAFTSYLSGLHGPIIFGGDLNAPPLSKPMRRIQRMATDAYMESHIWGDFTFRTDFPRMRLDYLFCMNQVIPDQAQRPHLMVSDHFPVVADFWIPAGTSIQTKKGDIAIFH